MYKRKQMHTAASPSRQRRSVPIRACPAHASISPSDGGGRLQIGRLVVRLRNTGSVPCHHLQLAVSHPSVCCSSRAGPAVHGPLRDALAGGSRLCAWCLGRRLAGAWAFGLRVFGCKGGGVGGGVGVGRCMHMHMCAQLCASIMSASSCPALNQLA